MYDFAITNAISLMVFMGAFIIGNVKNDIRALEYPEDKTNDP